MALLVHALAEDAMVGSVAMSVGRDVVDDFLDLCIQIVFDGQAGLTYTCVIQIILFVPKERKYYIRAEKQCPPHLAFCFLILRRADARRTAGRGEGQAALHEQHNNTIKGRSHKKTHNPKADERRRGWSLGNDQEDRIYLKREIAAPLLQ